MVSLQRRGAVCYGQQTSASTPSMLQSLSQDLANAAGSGVCGGIYSRTQHPATCRGVQASRPSHGSPGSGTTGEWLWFALENMPWLSPKGSTQTPSEWQVWVAAPFTGHAFLCCRRRRDGEQPPCRMSCPRGTHSPHQPHLHPRSPFRLSPGLQLPPELCCGVPAPSSSPQGPQPCVASSSSLEGPLGGAELISKPCRCPCLLGGPWPYTTAHLCPSFAPACAPW